VGLTTSHLKKDWYECMKGPKNLTDYLNKLPKFMKIDMRFGTWNEKNLYRAGSLRQSQKNYQNIS
jgi:hypothetical protein